MRLVMDVQSLSESGIPYNSMVQKKGKNFVVGRSKAVRTKKAVPQTVVPNRPQPSATLSSGRLAGGLVKAPAVPRFALAQVDPFNPSVLGVKVPDENAAPSATNFARALGTISTSSLGGGGAAFRFDPNGYEVEPITSGATAWVWNSTYQGGNFVPTAGTMETSYSLVRTVAWGVQFCTRQSFTDASGVLHLAIVPENLTGTTWPYPQSVSALEAAAWYKRVPIADLIDSCVIVPGRFADFGAFRYRSAGSTTAVQASAPIESSSGWMVLVAYIEGPASITNAVDWEYIAHYEGFVNQGASLLTSTPAAPYSPSIMAATKNMIEALEPIAVTSDIGPQPGFWDSVKQTYDAGLKVANGLIDGVGKAAKLISPVLSFL